MNYTILVVDDLEKLCKIIVKDLELVGYKSHYVTNGMDAIRIFSEVCIHLVLLDLKLGDEDGLDVLKKMKQIKPFVPIIMITGHGTISNAVQAIKSGAYDYIQKPVNFDRLNFMIQNAINLANLKEENTNLKQLLTDKIGPLLITIDPAMQSLLEKLKKLSATDYPIFIEGESGTGKELFADFLHSHSARKHQELFKINCAAFSDTLLDDELFGHYKGAFTGAHSDFKGIFERADNGSLFLDEIGDMPLPLQAKILRTLQNSEVRRLGGNKNILVDVRFIAATNKNIRELTNAGKFREDLFFRLNTAMITVPPLRDRKDDIPLLTGYFIKQSTLRAGLGEMHFSPAVADFFKSYSWPGNIRELKNVVNYCCTVCNGDIIDFHDLPNYLITTPNVHFVSKEQRIINEGGKIVEALISSNYNKTKAAEALKISRRTLYIKMDKYKIDN